MRIQNRKFLVEKPSRIITAIERNHIMHVAQAVCRVAGIRESELFGKCRERKVCIGKSLFSGILFEKGYGLSTQKKILPPMNEGKDIDHTTIRRRVENFYDWQAIYPWYRKLLEDTYLAIGTLS